LEIIYNLGTEKIFASIKVKDRISLRHY